MINQARTLLLNLPGEPGGYRDEPGEEFIPPEFRGLSLSGPLHNMRVVLFGSNPDRFGLNYAVRAYLGLLHATELVEYVLALDPRITYDVLPRDELYSRLFYPEVRKLSGTTADLFLLQSLGPPGNSGRTRHQWQIEVQDGDTVEVRRLTPPASALLQNYTVEAGLSSLITLTGSGLEARFQEGVGSLWQVTGFSRPNRDLARIYQELLGVGSSVENVLGVGSSRAATEPFRTFLQLWRQHPDLPYRVGGALLGWVYRASELLD